MITPTEKQREFIESNLPALTWETPGPGSGGTTALIMAAMRDMRVNGHRALLLKGHAPLWPILVEDIQRLAPQHGLTEVQRREWVIESKGSTLRAGAAHSVVFTGREQYDFIGIDDVEHLDIRTLDAIAFHLRPGGRLRCTRNTQRLDELLGPRLDGRVADPASLDPSVMKHMAQNTSIAPENEPFRGPLGADEYLAHVGPGYTRKS
jgi:hypothetical protein